MHSMKETRNRYAEALAMYESGLSIADVAAHYGVTRQAMWEWMKRRGATFRQRERFKEANHFYRGGKRSSDRCHNTLETAIKKGIVERKTACESCGQSITLRDGRSGIQAHHCDYNKPLDVMWLCQPCHHEWHKNNKAIPERR